MGQLLPAVTLQTAIVVTVVSVDAAWTLKPGGINADGPSALFMAIIPL
ncbi:hypothetical protein [Sphingomonas sp. UYP23]